MAAAAVFIGTPRCWMNQVSTANTNLDGSGTLADIVTGGTNGTLINAIRVKAEGTTTAGMVRFFLYDGSANSWLIHEEAVTANTPDGTTKSFDSGVVTFNNLVIPNGWKLQASTHNGETFTVFAFGGDY